MLNGLNQYSETVTLPEGTYYCNAAVQYDALNDWPLREVHGTTFLQVEAGGQYEAAKLRLQVRVGSRK